MTTAAADRAGVRDLPSLIDRQSFVAQIGRRALEGVDAAGGPRAMFDDVCSELAKLLGVDFVEIVERRGASEPPIAHGVISRLGVPIHAGPREFGVLAASARVPHAFAPEDTHLLVAVANILGAAIAHAETRAALDDSRALLETVFQGSSDLIVIVDPAARVRAASPSVQRIVGYDPPDLIGRSALDFVHPADQGRAQITLARALDDAEPLTAELRVRHADGSWRTFEAVGRAVGPRDALLIVIDARDVTERRLVEQRLLQAQKLEAVARVTASVAHDLNNVLQAIGMTVTFEDPELSRQEIATMVQQGARLIRALLMFARDRRSEPARLDARVVIEPLLPMLRRLVGRDILVRFVACETPVWIYADPLEIEQIVINLVVNARDAMTTTGEITITLDTRGDGFGVIQVIDQGCGIDDATRARMFEPFFTTKDPDRGSGLGLATVQSIVNRRHGRIDVVSALGVGTAFTIALPDGALP